MCIFHISQVVKMILNHAKPLTYSTTEFHTNWGLTKNKLVTKTAGHYETQMKRMKVHVQ